MKYLNMAFIAQKQCKKVLGHFWTTERQSTSYQFEVTYNFYLIRPAFLFTEHDHMNRHSHQPCEAFHSWRPFPAYDRDVLSCY